MPSTQVIGFEVLPPPPPTQGRVNAGWSEEVRAALTGSSLKEVHHALIGAALKEFWSTETGMREVFKGLITSFEVFFCICIKNNLPASIIYKLVYLSKDVFTYITA